MPASAATKKSKLVPIITVLFAILLLVLFTLKYPPLMIFGLDVLVIAGFILIPIAASKAWRYEIDRIGKIMRDIENHLDQFKALDERQQEEYEQYHILKSTEQSIKTLEETPGHLSREQHEQLRYLKKQNRRNKFLLAKRGLFWTFRSMHPKRSGSHPSIFKNLHTIFTNNQFQSLRHLIVSWLIISIIIGYLAIAR